jgi:uncharacterized protein YodC (DUF2158 family)
MAEFASDAHALIIVPVSEDSVRVGDIVELRNGGPAMTVQARSQNLAYCAWPREGRLHYGTFEVGTLRCVRSAPRARDSSSERPRSS